MARNRALPAIQIGQTVPGHGNWTDLALIGQIAAWLYDLFLDHTVRYMILNWAANQSQTCRFMGE